jgi:hypothetical protein
MSQLKTQNKELRDQLENHHRLSYQPYHQQPRYRPYQRPINQQQSYQPQPHHKNSNFTPAQDQTQPPRSYDEQLLYEVREIVYGLTENV